MPRPEKGSQEAKEWAKKMAEARKAKRTQKDNEGTKIVAPVFGESELVLPEYFVEEKKNGGYKLVNPTSQERNLSTRKGRKSINISRKPVKEGVFLEGMSDAIPLSLFSPKDRMKIAQHLEQVEQYKNMNKRNVPSRRDPKPKERGRPETLPKNIDINKSRKENIRMTLEDTNVAQKKKKKKKRRLVIVPPDDDDDDQPPPPPDDPPQAPRRGRPTKYATEEEKKQKKREQTLASNKRKREEKKAQREGTTGGSLVSTAIDVWNKGIVQTAKDKIDVGKQVITGNITKLSPKNQQILDTYGADKIKGIVLKRTPVSGLLTGALNVFSLGKFGKRQKLKEYDELFHLFMEFFLETGKRITLEKNERITITINAPNRPNTETLQVSPIDPDMDLNEIIKKTRNYMGDKAFFSYSAKDNNCQDFLGSVLKANNIGNQDDYNFVKQDTKELFRDMPRLRKLSNTLTSLGARGRVLLEGGDINSQIEQLKKGKMNKIKMNKIARLTEMKHINEMKGKGVGNESDSDGSSDDGFGSDDSDLEGDGIDNVDDIDFDNLKWGSFTNQFDRYNATHKKSPLKDLESFAKMILKDPKKFSTTTTKRARFYLNVLLPKKNKISGNSINMVKGVKKLSKKAMKAIEKEMGGDGLYVSGLGGDGLYAGEGMYAGSGACSMCGSGMGGAVRFHHPILDEIDGGGIFKKAGNWFKKAGKTINEEVVKPTQKAFKKGGVMEKVGRKAFREAVPTLTGALGGLAGSYGGPGGSLAGSYLGSKGGQELVKMSGVGRKPRSSAWIDEVKAVQKAKGISYKEALQVASANRRK